MARDTLLALLALGGVILACAVLALWPPLVEVIRRIPAIRRLDRQIEEWIEQDAPRP